MVWNVVCDPPQGHLSVRMNVSSWGIKCWSWRIKDGYKCHNISFRVVITHKWMSLTQSTIIAASITSGTILSPLFTINYLLKKKIGKIRLNNITRIFIYFFTYTLHMFSNTYFQFLSPCTKHSLITLIWYLIGIFLFKC